MGNSVQLQATGGSAYNWFSAFGGLSDNSIASYSLTNLQTLNTINQIQNVFSNLSEGNYLLQITDNNGCSFIDTISINDVQVNCTVPDTINLTVPNVFTPNFDGNNDNFVLQLIPI